ncbi:hypothetical protein chiPu_0025716 [Chiloscyllium punctatum]|uniref:Uncharacterized protein n=1 Tax=Chiloscyllium punctatum TaxID=137246 RepID=A0A401TG71_CHIPU|nr:hypothetical protein [Chiloscyllium punctatum]
MMGSCTQQWHQGRIQPRWEMTNRAQEAGVPQLGGGSLVDRKADTPIRGKTGRIRLWGNNAEGRVPRKMGGCNLQ